MITSKPSRWNFSLIKIYHFGLLSKRIPYKDPVTKDDEYVDDIKTVNQTLS